MAVNLPDSDNTLPPPIVDHAYVKQLEATITRLEQQIRDDAIELEATVDEFRRTQDELEQAKAAEERSRKEAERANTVKSAFLASMSHELRTPLNSIINFTKFVVRGVMGPVNERQVETLTNVIVRGEHLLSLINDVLDISKIESGSLNLFPEAGVNIGEIIADAAKTAESLLAEKPVAVLVDVAPDLPTLT
ncbi:MAG: hypothetical protein K8I82_16270, partial [Anaerolineae bacterium]|nr:hypothetical protein [Anaerolineae bacterium]